MYSKQRLFSTREIQMSLSSYRIRATCQKIQTSCQTRHCSSVGCSTLTRFSSISTRPWVAGIARPWSSNLPIIPQRGARKRAGTAQIDLPQGAIPLVTEESQAIPQSDSPEYPIVLKQAQDNMIKFSHCVLLTRVGGFYELYLEQAEIYGPLLNLRVGRKKTSRGPVPMAGFPVGQLDRFLKILVQDLNKYVALSEEFSNDAVKRVKSGGLLFDRKVTRIITPGTLIDENFMDPYQSNYLLSININAPSKELGTKDSTPVNEPIALSGSDQETTEVGIAWLDLSSGDFFTQTTNMISLVSIVARIGPREIILDNALRDIEDSNFIAALREERYIVTYQETPRMSQSLKEWESMIDPSRPGQYESSYSSCEVIAAGSLLQYVKTQLLGTITRLHAPIRYQPEDYMAIDKNTLKALEIKTTLKSGRQEGSLLHSLKRTATKSGTRLLDQRLTTPSMSIPVIQDRLNLVDELVQAPTLRESIVSVLMQTFDTSRLIQKFAFGRGDADHLIQISKTILATSDLRTLIDNHLTDIDSSEDQISDSASLHSRTFLHSLIEQMTLEEPLKLANRIIQAIDEEGLSEQHRLEDNNESEMENMAQDGLGEQGLKVTVQPIQKRPQSKILGAGQIIRSNQETNRYVWILRRSASSTLDTLHEELDKLIMEQVELEKSLRERIGAESLVLKWTPTHGHICHVKGKDASRLGATGAKSVSSSKSTRSFHAPEWTELGNKIDETKAQIRTEEQRLIGELRAEIVLNTVSLRKNAAVLDELDVACSFAIIASEKNYVRPVLNHSTSHKIIGGRHPVVEVGLAEQGRQFTSNDCTLGDSEKILLITGPNMAGKSTFLRQNALISILAQTGSFVPAEYAEIGLVDKIFSRVGSADNLYQDQSTFMVEMLETADILRQATPRSFVIMDEVGRGTTPEDGIAVGFACLDYLYKVNRSRVLFATHFHVLTDMTHTWEKLACYCTDLKEDDDGESWMYVHKVRKGVNRKSHALKVARVAGMPKEAIAVAERVLNDLKT